MRVRDTLPEIERVDQTRALDTRGRALASRVDELLAELEDPLQVAEGLRRAADLADADRHAALRQLRASLSER